jgi:hypothetical protein
VNLAVPADWPDISNTATGTSYSIAINPARTNVFYRLRKPQTICPDESFFAGHGSGGKSSRGWWEFGPQRLGSLRADNFYSTTYCDLKKRFLSPGGRLPLWFAG